MVSSSKRTNWIDRGIQLGRSPSWINHGFSSAVRRAGPIQFGERPSWINHEFSSAIRRAGQVQFGKRLS
ncbi:hypothetical protein F2Q69_00013735 [Brassica cretica]|uniref:Uncharacterized protein n=1 Tax=Brassica cretica TaxID=69181 RepID=A0A8S9R4F0_BRACR|nr:hypothetical protein F2Q69_00013735 [Brassica cretica]